jgi:hypothetical protein
MAETVCPTPQICEICGLPFVFGYLRFWVLERGPDRQCEPAHKFRRRHPAFAFKLNLQQQ